MYVLWGGFREDHVWLFKGPFVWAPKEQLERLPGCGSWSPNKQHILGQLLLAAGWSAGKKRTTNPKLRNRRFLQLQPAPN